MKNAKIIVVLALLTLFLSGCANVGRSEVSAPSLQETVTAEPAQSTMPQEQATVSVSESTEIPAESTAEPDPVETKPEISTSAKEETPPVSSPTETTPPKAPEPAPPEEPTETQPQETEPEPTEPSFDIQTWIDYAKAYAESVGLRLESSAVDCWDNPISAGAHCSYLERDIQSRLNRYGRDEDITDVWIWAEARSDGKYDLYIGYA